MKIIKAGKKPEYKRRFECRECGCVFIAEKSEYRTVAEEYQCVSYVCKCPCCGERCYGGQEYEQD